MVKIPFIEMPPPIVLPNNKSAVESCKIQWVRETLVEYLRFGFIEKVSVIPYCVMPLQIKDTGGKTALIYDMSVLNDYVEKNKFKLEGWEEMFNYASSSEFGIKFDLKKFYHEIDIAEEHKTFFGFMYQMVDGGPHEYFVWATMPYGYTRAPYIAKSIMKPLVSKWRRLGCKIVVFYDDGMAVEKSEILLKKQSLQIQCDLLRAGLVPGVKKCLWTPTKILAWNGLVFDFQKGGISVMEHRMNYTTEKVKSVLEKWPVVTVREVSQFLGQINSMHPVLKGQATLRSKMLQTFINIRHFKNSSWESLITSDFPGLFEKAKEELKFWQKNLEILNFRPFKENNPTCLGWVDASNHAIGGIMVTLKPGGCEPMPVTLDNWILDGAGALPRIRNCAKLQVDDFPPGSNKCTEHDLDKEVVQDMYTVHRNLTYAERATDSNERELLAAVELILGCLMYLKNCIFTLHFDNMNASSVVEKGSSKFRLQNYAVFISNICLTHNISLRSVWIPRCLNNVADKLSKMLDYDDYSVEESFYNLATQISKYTPNFDRFANNWNSKCQQFNSVTYCVGSGGVDAFNYTWGGKARNWLFPPVRLIIPTVLHLEKSKGNGLLLIPQWKNAAFYPFLEDFIKTKFVKNRWVLGGKNVFRRGADSTTCFGPDFTGNVELWLFDFNM